MDLNSFSKDSMAENLIIKHGALLLLNFEVINIGYIWIKSHCIGLTHMVDHHAGMCSSVFCRKDLCEAKHKTTGVFKTGRQTPH